MSRLQFRGFCSPSRHHLRRLRPPKRKCSPGLSNRPCGLGPTTDLSIYTGTHRGRKDTGNLQPKQQPPPRLSLRPSKQQPPPCLRFRPSKKTKAIDQQVTTHPPKLSPEEVPTQLVKWWGGCAAATQTMRGCRLDLCSLRRWWWWARRCDPNDAGGRLNLCSLRRWWGGCPDATQTVRGGSLTYERTEV
jgi:hypothetical protein